jgi:UDP-N-acetylglucosamine acyltransferase
MNRISKLAKIGKNVQIGVNNIIGDYTVIADNVIIGNNNRIYPFNKIYPNVSIGNDNIFLENNIIGEHPITMDSIFTKKIYNGVNISNNNFFHCNNSIFGGYAGKTIIGDYNKIMYNNIIHHDVNITSNVNTYPSAHIGGYCVLLPFSGVGMSAAVHQKKVIGSYSFVGMLSASTKHVFPFLITVGNKYTRVNTKRSPEITQKFEKQLFELMEQTQKNIPDNLDDKIKEFPKEISEHLTQYFQNVLKIINYQ